jgi:hypothetical protein
VTLVGISYPVGGGGEDEGEGEVTDCRLDAVRHKKQLGGNVHNLSINVVSMRLTAVTHAGYRPEACSLGGLHCHYQQQCRHQACHVINRGGGGGGDITGSWRIERGNSRELQ